MCVFIRAPPCRSGAPRAAGPRLTRRPKDSGRAPADSFLPLGGGAAWGSPRSLNPRDLHPFKSGALQVNLAAATSQLREPPAVQPG